MKTLGHAPSSTAIRGRRLAVWGARPAGTLGRFRLSRLSPPSRARSPTCWSLKLRRLTSLDPVEGTGAGGRDGRGSGGENPSSLAGGCDQEWWWRGGVGLQIGFPFICFSSAVLGEIINAENWGDVYINLDLYYDICKMEKQISRRAGDVVRMCHLPAGHLPGDTWGTSTQCAWSSPALLTACTEVTIPEAFPNATTRGTGSGEGLPLLRMGLIADKSFHWKQLENCIKYNIETENFRTSATRQWGHEPTVASPPFRDVVTYKSPGDGEAEEKVVEKVEKFRKWLLNLQELKFISHKWEGAPKWHRTQGDQVGERPSHDTETPLDNLTPRPASDRPPARHTGLLSGETVASGGTDCLTLYSRHSDVPKHTGDNTNHRETGNLTIITVKPQEIRRWGHQTET